MEYSVTYQGPPGDYTTYRYTTAIPSNQSTSSGLCADDTSYGNNNASYIDLDNPGIQDVPDKNEKRKQTKSTLKRKKNVDTAKPNAKKQKLKAEQVPKETGNKVKSGRMPLECNDHKCYYKCTIKFTEQERIDINRKYWGLGNYGKQRLFINLTVISKERKRITVGSTRRTATFDYRLNNKKVCRQFYMATLNISHSVIMNVKKRERNQMDVTKDMRGYNSKKINDEVLNEVRDHIKSFDTTPPIKGDSNRRYLSSDLNIQKMYDFFKVLCPDSTVTLHTYRKIFQTEFNLGFNLPSTTNNQNKKHKEIIISAFDTDEIERIESESTLNQPEKVNVWKSEVSRKKRNAGEAYITKSGQIVPEKTPIDCSDHSCRFKCNKNFTEEDRFNINRKYWNLADYGKQRLFINLTIISKKCARKTAGEDSRRQSTYEYRLNDKRVCKAFYLATLHISDGLISGVKNREKQNLDVTVDRRGKQRKRKPIPEEALQNVRDHINSFATVPFPNSPSKEYVHGIQNITKMYEMFKQVFPNSNLKIHTYKKVFRTEFDLTFYKQKSS